MTQKDERFYQWWVSHKGRPPTLEDRPEFESAKAIWEELLGQMDASPAIQHTKQLTYADGWKACAAVILSGMPPLLRLVWDEWAADLMPEWANDEALQPERIEDRARVSFRALRSESEDEFIVARLVPGAEIASLDAVDEVVCEVRTDRGNDAIMRNDYRAAEAFAALLTVLPQLIALQEYLERGLGRRMPYAAVDESKE